MTGRILITGNDAVGMGAIDAGCDCYFGYPITPQNELTAYMATHMPEQSRVFIQAESELAAINMVFGASAAGKRAMTSSSSPGISLKQEGISYLAGAELPSVIVNVQRAGPGLGSIAPAQGDYFQATKGGGHGDYHCIVLAPDCVQEMHDLTMLSFDLADRYRMPAIVLADGRLGQMMEPLQTSDTPPSPPPEKPWALTGAKGRRPNWIRSLFLGEGELEAHNKKLQARYLTISETEVRAEERQTGDAEILIVAYGTCARIVKGCIDKLRSRGIRAGLLRPITLWPFPSARIAQIAAGARGVLTVEMSSGQMLEDVRLAVNGKVSVAFEGRMGGAVPEESAIMGAVERMMPS